MNQEELRAFCLSLPSTTEDIKWGHDLCFCIGGKMFCVTGLEPSTLSAESPLLDSAANDLGQSHSVSFKVTPEEFDGVCQLPGFGPAPYVARYHWVLLKDPALLSRKKLEGYVKQSYQLVKEGLSKKVKKELGLF